jgi:hypothetical protein
MTASAGCGVPSLWRPVESRFRRVSDGPAALAA